MKNKIKKKCEVMNGILNVKCDLFYWMRVISIQGINYILCLSLYQHISLYFILMTSSYSIELVKVKFIEICWLQFLTYVSYFNLYQKKKEIFNFDTLRNFVSQHQQK